MTKDLTIGCILYNEENTRAGRLEDFFTNIEEVENEIGSDTQRIVLVDDKTTDRTFEISRRFTTPEYYHFENFSQAKNLLLEKSKGKIVFIPEADMRYIPKAIKGLFKTMQKEENMKSLEAMQKVVRSDHDPVHNFYYLFLRNSPEVRFQGLDFDTVRGVYPHEIKKTDIIIGTHFMEPYKTRMESARNFIDKELKELGTKRDIEDPIELYWTSMRYSELGLMGSLDNDSADKMQVELLSKAIRLKVDFGPAYFELAKQHLHMGRGNQARRVANKGIESTGYGLCNDILKYLM
jgi:glycosyltransferase involved in cell wall biosynthesis